MLKCRVTFVGDADLPVGTDWAAVRVNDLRECVLFVKLSVCRAGESIPQAAVLATRRLAMGSPVPELVSA